MSGVPSAPWGAGPHWPSAPLVHAGSSMAAALHAESPVPGALVGTGEVGLGGAAAFGAAGGFAFAAAGRLRTNSSGVNQACS